MICLLVDINVLYYVFQLIKISKLDFKYQIFESLKVDKMCMRINNIMSPYEITTFTSYE